MLWPMARERTGEALVHVSVQAEAFNVFVKLGHCWSQKDGTHEEKT